MEQSKKLTFKQFSSYLVKNGDDLTAETLPRFVEGQIGRKPTVEELTDAKWKLAAFRAQRTATWAKTLTKKLISQSSGTQPRWHVVNFIGKKAEPRGIVDLLAIRKNHHDPEAPLKRGDLFEVVILQVKGGKAPRPNEEERERLRRVAKLYNAKILLSEWKQGKKPIVSQLKGEKGDDWVKLIDAADVFSPDRKSKSKTQAEKRASSGNAARTSSNANSAGVAPATPTLKGNAQRKAWATRKSAAAIGKKQ